MVDCCHFDEMTIQEVVAYFNSIAKPEDFSKRIIFAEAIDKALNTLSPKERKVLELEFGLNGEVSHTLKEISQDMELPYEKVRQVRRRAIRRLLHPSRVKYLFPLIGKEY